MSKMSDADLTVREYVAERLMQESGFGDREANPLEWDATNPYSQYATNLDIAETCVNATVEALDALGVLQQGQKKSQYEVETQHPIHRQATIYLFLEPAKGQPLTLGDLRQLMREVDALYLPNSTELEGNLSVMYDIGLSPDQLVNYFGPHTSKEVEAPFSPEHPSVVGKDPKLLLEKTYQALLKKYAYLLDQGEEAEAAKIFDEIQRVKDVARR